MEELVLAGGAGRRRRRLSAREEELLGLLAGFPDGGGAECGSGRELSFSDLVEAGCAAATPGADHGAPAPREDPAAAAAAASKMQRQQAARQRARRSGGGSRGSCGGSGDGVLLNFYVPPGLLTRSMTAPRPAVGRCRPGQGRARRRKVPPSLLPPPEKPAGHKRSWGSGAGRRCGAAAAGQGLQLKPGNDRHSSDVDTRTQTMLPAPPTGVVSFSFSRLT